MGLGKTINFKSNSIEYSSPLKIVNPLIDEFNIIWDVCASDLNFKCQNYWTIQDDAMTKTWNGNCWMNPPFNKDLGKWVKKMWTESKNTKGTKVCLIPVRSNTKWWNEVINDAEIRFINGEVNFNDEPRGLWLPMCILIFGEGAKKQHFSSIDYRRK